MADFGLYSALRGQDVWNVKRQDAAMGMQIAQIREQRAEQDLQKQNQIDAGMQAAYDELANLDVLPEDAERIKAIEQQSRKSIVKGIAKNNGDLKRYMSLGGQKDLQGYRSSVLGSEQYKNAMANKMNLSSYVKDRSDNKFLKSTLVDVPQMDEKTGQMVTKPMQLSFEQQMKLFQDKKIERLNYGGSEDKVNISIKDFADDFKNSLNPYQQDNVVSVSNIYEKAMSMGASEEQAQKQAQSYGNMVKQGGDYWTWKAGDINELNMKREDMQMKREMHSAKLREMATKEKATGVQKRNTLGNIQEYLAPNSSAPMLPNHIEMWSKVLGLTPIGEGKNTFAGGKFKFTGDVLASDLSTKIPAGGGEIIPDPISGSLFTYRKGPDGKMYMSANMMFDDDDAAVADSGFFGTGLGQGVRPELKNKIKKNGSERTFGFADDNYSLEVNIPLDTYFNNEEFRMGANQKFNVTTNATNAAVDYTSGAKQENAGQMQQLIDEYNASQK